MLSTKNYSNNSSVNATTATFTYLEVEEATINNYYNSSSIDSNFPTFDWILNNYTNSYDLGGYYYTKYDIDSNFYNISQINDITTNQTAYID